MMFGMGDATAAPAATTTTSTAGTTATTVTPTFNTGLTIWETPSNGFTALTSTSWGTALSQSANYPFLAGLLLPPVAVAGILLYAMSGSSKRARR